MIVCLHLSGEVVCTGQPRLQAGLANLQCSKLLALSSVLTCIVRLNCLHLSGMASNTADKLVDADLQPEHGFMPTWMRVTNNYSM